VAAAELALALVEPGGTREEEAEARSVKIARCEMGSRRGSLCEGWHGKEDDEDRSRASNEVEI
jgi:hypothetical protein